jgi:dUTP pyrophosphatase
MSLYIYAEDKNLREMLREHLKNHRWTDSGFDIAMLSHQFVGVGEYVYPHTNYGIKLGIQVAAVSDEGHTRPCLLLPRSSIGRTPFRITNSIGLIDQGYRGEVQAKVDVLENPTPWPKGTRLFQICRHDFLPWNDVILVDSESDLPPPPDTRGSGGFGSTGR